MLTCRSPAEFGGEYLRFGQRLFSGFQSDKPVQSTKKPPGMPRRPIAFEHAAALQNGCKMITRPHHDYAQSHQGHHYAFHVSDAEFDAIFRRVQEAALTYGSKPWSADDRKLNDWGGGRGVYFRTPDGHLLELMTVPQ